MATKKIEHSNRPSKLKVLYQQTVHLLEEEIPKQLQRQNKLAPYPTNFVEDHPKQARKCKASLDYHWLAHIGKGIQPQKNAEKSNTTPAVNDSGATTITQRTTQLIKQYKKEQQQAAKIRRMFPKHRQQSKDEERMKKFNIQFETKMLLEQARFERRNLKLEMQMKELETKHHLLDEERELERKVKRTALENGDVRSQSTSARDKSPFIWTPKKRDVSDWTSRIDNLLTLDR